MAAAEVYLSETNGAGAVVTDDVANCNFGGVDTPNLVPATFPCVRSSTDTSQAIGSAWSFEKFWRVKVNALNDSGLVEHLKVWKTSGAYVSGESIWRSNGAATPYTTPVNTQPDNSPIEQLALPTSEPANPGNIGIGGSYSGQIVAAPAYSNYFAMQLAMNCSALTPTGSVNQKIFIWQYDES